jgi:steroid 5-alpha reductase family enzyme
MANSTASSTSRSTAFAYVALAYVAAIAAGIGAAYLYRDAGWHPLVLVLVADVVATVVIFIFSFIFKNSSFYDPYWSVIPIVIVAYFAWLGAGIGDPLRIGMLVFLVSFWGVRLTYNWVRGWTGLHHEDWRYVDFQRTTGKWYWLVSFSGIHLFPTILVFLGCMALYPAMVLPGRALNALDVFAFLFTFGAVLIELIADEQLHRFKKIKKPGETLTSGLWAYSRHPNYFGEVSFWWGLFFFAMAADPTAWWTIVGALSMTLLFFFISIPMIDKRMLKRRKDYEQIMKRIPAIVPWFPKKG